MVKWLLVGSFAVVGCGVPEAKYNAAVKDAQSARGALQSAQGELAECNDKGKGASEKEAEIKRLREALAAAEGKAATEDDRAQLEALKREKAEAESRAKLADDFVKKFKTMIDAGKLKIAVRHGRLVLQLSTDVLFDPGKTEIKPAGKQALAEIAQALRGVAGRKFQVAGHTDYVPIKTKEFPSNWELSTARALEVVKLLIDKGVNPAALSAAGYSQFDPVSGNLAFNRRIEITLQPDMGEIAKLPEAKP